MFTFKIESSKDISFLKVDFTDGSCVSKTNDSKTNTEKESKVPRGLRKDREKYLDTNVDFQHKKDYNQIVELPKIDEKERPAKVSENLQNLEF